MSQEKEQKLEKDINKKTKNSAMYIKGNQIHTKYNLTPQTRDSVVNCRTTDPIQNYILCLNRYTK